MSTLILDEPHADATVTSDSGAERLRLTMTAMRLSFTWFGVRKTLSAEQRGIAADAFDAERDFLSAGKKLIDTKHPLVRAVGAVRSQAVQFWRSVSLPYPEPGIRLVRQSDLENIFRRMEEFRDELSSAVAQLESEFPVIKRAARERLGNLYNESDYPATLAGMFDMIWEFPSVEPPNYLRQLAPEIYQQQCDRVQARFQEAVALAEQAFVEELSRMVSHLSERLSGRDDGRPKIFRDTAVTNLAEFFERFRTLNVGSNQELDQLVSRAQRIVRGVSPQHLRDDQQFRQQLASQLSGVQSALDGLLVDRPRRNILRRGAPACSNSADE